MINKKSLFPAIMIIAILLSVSTVIAANDNDTVYVSTTGNDANLGTSDSPLKTITKAVEVAPVNGLVFVKSGTYRGEGDIVIDKNLSVIGENQATTIIDGSAYLRVSPAPYDTITVKGLTFQNMPYSSIIGISVPWVLGEDIYHHVEISSNATIEDCTFINSCKALTLYYYANVRNCSFINNSGFFAGAIESTGYGRNTILDCNFVNNTGDRTGAIRLRGDTVNNSYFSGNTGGTQANDVYSWGWDTRINNCVFDPSSNGKPSIGYGDGASVLLDGVYSGVYIK
jgi:hypothetical protein